MSYVSHLEGALDGARLPARVLHGLHAGRPILVRYDLERLRAELPRAAVEARAAELWRWRELLPLEDSDERVSLGEAQTPLVALPRLARELGLGELLVKDESRLPTGSFKARGMALALSMAKALGVTRVALPSAGNAGGAAAAYAARAGLECFVFLPEDTPLVNQLECVLHGARAFLVDGLIHECGALVREGVERMRWFDLSTLKEPYRLEGKKTMGLELALQLDWRLPDAIFYPTGGGTGLIGMHKAFDELEALGWLAGPRPRLYACQAAGCAPIVRAFEAGLRFAEPIADARTAASGLRVPAAVGDFLILDAVRASGGRALAVEEHALLAAMRRTAAREGLAPCPETGACLAALAQARAAGWVRTGERVLVFQTGAATKYVELLAAELPRLRRAALDWERIARA